MNNVEIKNLITGTLESIKTNSVEDLKAKWDAIFLLEIIPDLDRQGDIYNLLEK